MKSKNNLTKGLIVASVLLLMMLEFVWIQKVVRDAKFDLRRHVSIIFERTLFSMQDSVIQKNMRSVPDSLITSVFTKRFQRGDISFRRRGPKGDSTLSKTLNDSAKIQVTFVGEQKSDTFKSILRPMMAKIRRDGRHRNFMLQLDMDTLRMKDIRHNYSQALQEDGIILPYEVKTIKRSNEPFPFDRTKAMVTTEPISISPTEAYVGVFDNLGLYLIDKIKFELAFAFLLTGLTITAFTVMYRNLRSQQRLMELKNSFISNVTHELKTPIATVSVALEALKNFNGIDNPKLTAEYLDIAKHELDRLSVLTEKVLTTSLFEEHGIAVQHEKMDVGNITDEIVHSMKLVFEKQNAIVSFQKTGDDFSIEGSTVHVTNVIYNLIDNALKYSPGNPIIKIELKDAGDRINLSFSDNGLGIPKEYQKKIFEKFFRMPTGDVHNIKGYGLGLSYVESVVKAHHGSIEVISEPEKGSTFVLTFPRTIKGKA